jgi:hypothetical protein
LARNSAVVTNGRQRSAGTAERKRSNDQIGESIDRD